MAPTPNTRNLMPPVPTRNRSLGTAVSELFDILKTPGASNFSSLSEFFSKTQFDGRKGLLAEMENLQTTNGRVVDFPLIEQETLSLYTLMYDRSLQSANNLSNYLQQAGLAPLGVKFEQAISTLLSQKVRRELPNPGLQTAFDTEINGQTTLAGLVAKIQFFLESNQSQIKKPLLIKNTFVSNKEISDELVRTGDIQPADIAGGSGTWNPEVKKAFDALLSHEVGGELGRSISQIQDLVGGIQSTFSNSMPVISGIQGKYPLKYETLKALYPDLEVTITQLEQEKIGAGDNEQLVHEIERKIDSAYWEKYVEEVAKSNPQLADTLKALWENDFNFSTLDATKMQHLLFFLQNEKFEQMIGKGALGEVLGIKGNDKLLFQQFMKDLVDLSKDEIIIPNGGIHIKVKKTVSPDVHPELKNREIRETADSLPLIYEIDMNIPGLEIQDKMALESLLGYHLNEDGTKAIISGKDMGRLIYLFFISNSSTPLSSLSPEVEKRLADKLGTITETTPQEKEANEKKEKLQDEERPQRPDETSVNEEKSDFQKAWNELKGYKFSGEENGGFKKGTRLWLTIGDSELPPFEVGGNQWVQMEILNVNESTQTFKVKLSGGELKAGGLEGKVVEYKMTVETLDALKKVGEGGIFKLPDPQTSEGDPVKQLQFLKDSNLGKKGLEAFDELDWDGKSFLYRGKLTDEEKGTKEKQKIEYFGYQDVTYDAGGKEIRQDIFYKIKYHPNTKTFTIQSTFNKTSYEEKNEGETKKYDYQQEMDYNGLMLFVAEKNLRPKTQKEYDESQKKPETVKGNRRKRTWNWYGLSTISSGIKGMFKKFNDGIENRKKEQLENFNDWMIEDLGIYDLVAKGLFFIPAVKEVAGGMQLEHYNGRDGKTWKKIESWLKIFESDPDFGTSFEQGSPYMNSFFGKGVTLQKMIGAGKYMEPPALYIAAAALIANIKQGKSPYRGLAGQANDGLWVKVLLGDAHHQMFMKDKQELINEIKSKKGDVDLKQDDLAKCEINYILNNIRGSNPGLRFGSKENRGDYAGVDPKTGKQIFVNEYKDNPSKRLLSDKFAGELDNTFSGWANKSSVDAGVEKMAHNNFQIALNDFNRFSKSGRFPSALSSFKKMGTLVKTEEHHRIFKRCFVIGLLSGLFNTYADKGVKTWIEDIARTYGFAPGLVVKDFQHPAHVKYLLDKATDGDFSKQTGYKLENFDISNPKIDHGDLIKKLETWWNTGENYKRVDKFLKIDLPTTDWSQGEKKDDLMEKFKQLLMSTSKENLDRTLLGNDKFVNHAGFASTKSVVQEKIDYRNGKFDGKDVDEESAKESFWSDIAKNVTKIADNPNTGNVEFAMKQFLNWFDRKGFNEGSREEIVRKLKTARKYQTLIKKNNGNPITKKESIKLESGMKEINKGSIGKDDIEKLLWFTFKGEVLAIGNGYPPQAFDDALSAFQKVFYSQIDTISDDKFIEKVFGPQYAKLEPYELVGWNEYNAVCSQGDNDYGFFNGFDPEDFDNSQPNKPVLKQERTWKKREYRDESRYLNATLKKKENSLKRINVSGVPTLGQQVNATKDSEKFIDISSGREIPLAS